MWQWLIKLNHDNPKVQPTKSVANFEYGKVRKVAILYCNNSVRKVGEMVEGKGEMEKGEIKLISFKLIVW